MKFRTHRALKADAGPRRTFIDSGWRVQARSQLAGIRHFRAGTADVKSAGIAREPQGWNRSLHPRAVVGANHKPTFQFSMPAGIPVFAAA